LIFSISLPVTLWNPVLGNKIWWGAFATPLLIHFVRGARRAAKTQGKEAALQPDEEKNVRD
jgi:hypothetical protein